MSRSSPGVSSLGGLGLLALLLAYAVWVHLGIGPVRDPTAFEWYQPRGFFFEWTSTDWLTDSLRSALLGLLTPALLLCVGVWLTLRSALARLLAVWALLFVGLCVYYGVEADGIWRFFHWRGSAVMAVFALSVAATVTAPWLARSLERLPRPLQGLLYGVVVVATLALMRNATGTDQSLSFAISPWPVVPVFGLELLVPAVAFVIAGVALARALLPQRIPGAARLALSGAAGALALGVLAGWAGVDSSADWRLPVATICVAALALAAAPAREASGHHAALGALLVAVPLLVGMAIVERDYTYTRDHRARYITEALQLYYEREDGYPDRLTELVDAGLLVGVPVPRVGFHFIDQPEFVYQNFGISYLLEFSTPRWVQCAYNPPYQDEEDFEEEEELEEEELPGSWSCPSKPPELW